MSEISSELLSTIDIPPSQLTLNSETVILNLVAAKNGAVLYIVISGLISRYNSTKIHRNFTTSDVGQQGKCRLQRWEYKEDTVFLDECFGNSDTKEVRN